MINMKKLNIIITGASSGIGKYIYQSFKDNYNMIGTYCTHHQENLYYLDIRYNKSINNFFEKINNNKIDVLINNAGINKDKFLKNMSIEEFEDVINVNLNGTFRMIKKIIPNMIENKFGRIINMGSVVGQKGNIGQSNYAASKAGIIGLTKSVSLEVAKYNITINTICPGFIDAGMVKKIQKNEIIEKIKNTIPLKRFGSPKDIVNTIQFLIDSSYITGSTINVNGGLF